MLVILAYGGYKIGNGTAMKYLLAILLPVVVGIVWGMVAAPRATRRLQQPARTIFKLILFIACAILLYSTGQTSYAIIFAFAACLNEIIAFFFKD